MEYRTTDFFEAAVMRALGARLVDVCGSHPGEAVLRNSFSRASVVANIERFVDELAQLPDDIEADDIRRLIDNTILSQIPGLYSSMKTRALRSRSR